MQIDLRMFDFTQDTGQSATHIAFALTVEQVREHFKGDAPGQGWLSKSQSVRYDNLFSLKLFKSKSEGCD